jgi:DnaJ-class molecular chaperone
MGLERLDQLDYYSLLRLKRNAKHDDIKRAFRLFARKFHPDRFPRNSKEGQRAAEVYRRATEAYRVLTTPNYRTLYDQALDQGIMRFDPSQMMTARSSQTSLMPRYSAKAGPFVMKAEQAVKIRDWQQARLNLGIALQHDPDSEYLREKLEEVKSKGKKKS